MSSKGSGSDSPVNDGDAPASPVYGNGTGNLHGVASPLKSRSKRSLHAHHAADTRRPIDKFRSTVDKIVAMQRSTTILTSFGAGAEPGIDPRRASMEMQYRGVQQECFIEVVDYSAVSASFTNMRNTEFVNWCSSSKGKRQPWVKVRWINIAGVSWDVIKALSRNHELHPLALEDVLHARPETLSKADYFFHHLFLRVLCHEVEEDEAFTSKRRKVVPEETEEQFSDIPGQGSKDAIRQRKIEEAKLRTLKQGTIKVAVTPMFIFLFRDGTVISITQDAAPDMLLPISMRLRRPDTVLRSSADPSMLVQSLLGLVVDKAVQLIDRYHEQISKIELQILIKPKPSSVRKLHIVSGDLVLHKRTLEPIKTLVYGLRRYDVDRCAALVDDSDPANSGKAVVGFMSHKSKIYLADVYDHTEYILSTLDMIAGIGESLTDYSFNVRSMNITVGRFVLISTSVDGVVFDERYHATAHDDNHHLSPLTFVSGYFGMNFDDKPWTTEWTDVLFWIIALPCVAVISPLFIIPDIKKMIHYIQTRKLLSSTARAFK
ncbi:hypothetical protein B0H10DRAFT_2229296 [Mycena sp. CBHHK59/15]|nr:hypothetical protein B0H10DRAFT_2229296 [Mycena sp. CBHHK59/15]